MKKFLVAIIALFYSMSSFGQYSSGGFDLDKENVYYGVRFWWNVGFYLGRLIGRNKGWSDFGWCCWPSFVNIFPVFLEWSLYYTQRGAKDGDYEVTHCNNLEIPLVVKYGFKATDEIALLPFIGPYFAYAVSADQKVKNVSLEEKGINRVYRNNMGFKLGCGAEYNKLYLELGYQFGITNIWDSDAITGHNNALFLNFGVNF